MHTISSSTPGQRPAELGEHCTCGHAAMVVFLGGQHGDTGYCGAPSTHTDCAWCDQPRHDGRCPAYPAQAGGGSVSTPHETYRAKIKACTPDGDATIVIVTRQSGHRAGRV